MRRLVLAVVLAAETLLLLPGEPAVAQGTTLPAPDFDNDGFGDLAVGAPGEDLGPAADAGVLDVLYNSDSGLGGGGRQQLTQADAAGAVEAGDRFGASLAVSVLFGSAGGGLGGAGSQFRYQGTGGLGGSAESGDAVGAALG